MKKYAKTQTFRSWGFLKFFAWSRNSCSSQNMVWVNSHVTGKVWENTNIPELRVAYIFHMKQKSIQFPNCGMSEFSCYGISMRKPRQFPGSALH